MKVYLLKFSILLIFCLGANIEFESMRNHFGEGEHTISSTSFDKSYDLNHCEDQNCQDEGPHCIHHCTGMQNIIKPQSLYHEESFQPDVLSIESSMPLRFQGYEEPFIDPALKPPLFA